MPFYGQVSEERPESGLRGEGMTCASGSRVQTWVVTIRGLGRPAALCNRI